MFISCWFRVKLTARIYFFNFICSLQKRYVFLTGLGAAALTGRRNVRGLSKADCRVRREISPHRYTIDDIETGENKLTVRTVRLKLLTGTFRLCHFLYLQTVIGLLTGENELNSCDRNSCIVILCSKYIIVNWE